MSLKLKLKKITILVCDRVGRKQRQLGVEIGLLKCAVMNHEMNVVEPPRNRHKIFKFLVKLRPNRRRVRKISR